MIHSDICELDGTLTRQGHRYFITFIDDCSDFTYVFLMKNISDAFDMIETFKMKLKISQTRKIKDFVVIEE